ncbi:sensor histidine kinase [Salinicola peritrichatus]|uniref:sensor histidine kinase n=1 Tax=Salinicola peritrichatus TaxID=1267424 RepID=UPI000DA1272B|nr:HAMP domain-containing sensor histidine kinase [Salinicola peritrichatus]
MSERRRFVGSFNSWFVANVIAAILIALAMNFIFIRFSGTWSNPPLSEIDQIAMAAGIAKTIDRIPSNERSSLTRELSYNGIHVSWFANRDDLPIPDVHEENDPDPDLHRDIVELLGFEDTDILAIDPDDDSWVSMMLPNVERFYALAIRLEDHSWLMFSTQARFWGLDSSIRWLLTAFFVLLSTLLISWVFGLRVARPMRHFARAVEQFGIGARRRPLEVRGPIEIRETLAAFNAMQTQIQRLLEGRVAMFSAISHDLRAPLTRLKLRSELVDDERQRHKIIGDIDELQSMVEACLAYFRLESQPEELTRLEFSELLHTVVDNFRDMGKKVAYHHARSVIYQGQPTALKRALTNLIDNAIKYGGHAEVELRVIESTIVVTIQDEGPGVPPENLPRLFDPFYRVEPSRNPQTGGYGLGLAASRSVVHFHGGELTIANRRPRGLIATIRLPLLEASPRLE